METRPSQLCKVYNRIATAALLLGVAIVWYAYTGESIRTETEYENLFYPLNVTPLGIKFELGPPMPHPPGPYFGRPGGDYGPAFLGLTLQYRTLVWRNAAVTWGFLEIAFPWWFLISLFVYRPIFRGLCDLDRSRIQAGMTGVLTRRANALKVCYQCHYDLRASPTRCPECGAAVIMYPLPTFGDGTPGSETPGDSTFIPK